MCSCVKGLGRDFASEPISPQGGQVLERVGWSGHGAGAQQVLGRQEFLRFTKLCCRRAGMACGGVGAPHGHCDSGRGGRAADKHSTRPEGRTREEVELTPATPQRDQRTSRTGGAPIIHGYARV